MNKTAIKNFAIWARNKLIADISYRAGLMGITADGIHPALPQSTGQTKFYDIGTAEPYAISGEAIHQREHLADLIRRKAKDSNYQIAYKYVIEEVAYTWFNRLIAVRFMEVNDYLPSHIRALSSDQGKIEPDLVTNPFDADLDFTRDEQQAIIDLKNDNKLDELFRLLFIKQCNALNEILPALFEKTNDYTELLLNLSVIDQDGVIYHLVHDIPEEDFDIERGGQVEIIGWLYQYYNTEPKNAAFAKKGKITKEEIPAVTQLFTPDWIVRYMVENSLGRLWIEHLLACGDFRTEAEIAADFGWKYYLPEAEQGPEVAVQLAKIREERRNLTPEEIRCIDPCMGSGHICVYLFSVLMQIYESAGYGQRDAASSILENNLYGLDIDDRAFQIAYFAVMMKAREYNRRILYGKNKPNLISIQDSNDIKREQIKYFGQEFESAEKEKTLQDMLELLDTFMDAKEYGSILTVESYDWNQLAKFVKETVYEGQISFELTEMEEVRTKLLQMIEQGKCLSQKYDVVVTNPPYMGGAGMDSRLSAFVKEHFPDSKSDFFSVFIERCHEFTRLYGFQAMITQPSFLFLSAFEKVRKRILAETSLSSLLHMGRGIFGIDFGSTSFVLMNERIRNYHSNSFRLHERNFQYIDPNDIAKIFLYAKEHHDLRVDYSLYDTSTGFSARMRTSSGIKTYYASNQDKYGIIPGNPIAYWVSDAIIQAFSKTLLGDIAETKQGFATGDNNRFLRIWQEVSWDKVCLTAKNREEALESGKKWFPCNKGGNYHRWYGNNTYIANWENDGKEMREFTGSVIRNPQYYFRTGITWSSISSGGLSMRYSPAGYVFESKGSMCYLNDNENLFYILGLMNTKIVDNVLLVLAPTLDYHEGPLAKVPVLIDDEKKDQVSTYALECVQAAKEDYDSFESSWEFQKHPFTMNGKDVEEAYGKWCKECERRFLHVKANEEKLNKIFIQMYGLKEELNPIIEDSKITISKGSVNRDIKSFLSYAVGCMLGRYSLDINGLAFAGGDFDLRKYKTFFPDEDNIIPITDEEYLEDDIVSRLCLFLKVIYGEDSLEKNLDFIASALEIKGETSREIIRNYFLNNYYVDHCSLYSATGKGGKRPIYWLFDSGKQNGFKALIYLHRYNPDTIGNLRIDYLHRMQRIYENEIMRMQDMIDHSTNAREAGQATKRKDKLTKQLKECREYDEKLAHLALSRIELDLDDGVKVNYRKMQTANDGKFYEVLADSKNIMAKR